MVRWSWEKLPKLTNWMIVGQGPIALAVGAGGVCLDSFTLIYPLSSLSPAHPLLGRKFIIRTDHAPLLWPCNFKNPSGILAWWISILWAYEYEIKFRTGT